MGIRRIGQLGALLVAVFALCWLSLTYSRGGTIIAAVWPANALVVAYILRSGQGLKGAVGIAVAAAGAMLLANIAIGRDAALSIGYPLANLAEIMAAAWVLRPVTPPLAKPSDYVRLLAGAAVLAPALSGLIATAVTAAGSPAEALGPSLARWVTSDGLGMAIVLPFAMTTGASWAKIRADRRRLLHGLGWQLAVAAVGVYVYVFAPLPSILLVLPFVMASVFVYREMGAAISLATIALIALAATAMGEGGLIHVAGSMGRDPMLMAQLSIAALVLTVQPVTAALGRLDAAIAELDSRRDMAEAQSRNKTKLLAHVSHEIRTPLSGVVTLAEMMRQGALGQLTPRQLDMITRIAESGSEIEALSRDLLDAASIQAGKTSMSKEIVEVSQTLETAVAAASFRLRDYKATVEMGEGVGAGLSVVADPMRLRQMLMNLIINAAKYGGRPPVVRIDAVAAPALGDCALHHRRQRPRHRARSPRRDIQRLRALRRGDFRDRRRGRRPGPGARAGRAAGRRGRRRGRRLGRRLLLGGVAAGGAQRASGLTPHGSVRGRAECYGDSPRVRSPP